MDEWKRQYSNTDDTRKACEWLWENFDAEGFSVHICAYRYQEELTKVFMSANLMNGFLQHLNALKKYGFGSIILLGDDVKSEIHGVFIVRGSELPKEMTESAEYHVYDFRKANIEDDAEKQYIEDILCWDGTFNGNPLKFNQGKVFK